MSSGGVLNVLLRERVQRVWLDDETIRLERTFHTSICALEDGSRDSAYGEGGYATYALMPDGRSAELALLPEYLLVQVGWTDGDLVIACFERGPPG